MNDSEQFPILLVSTVLILGVVTAIAWIMMMRRSGASMGRQSIEIIERSGVCDRSALIRGEVQVGTRKSFVRSMRFFYSTITLVYVASLFAPFWPIGIVGILMFGTGAIYCWRSDWIVAQANAEGITATDRNRKRFVAWSEIASCDVVTVHSMYGKFVSRYPVLKDAQGKSVFSTTFSYASQEDKDRLIEFIREA